MTTTTERRLELRLYVAALLAVVYTISWRALGAHAPAPATEAVVTPATVEPQRTRTVRAPSRHVPRVRTRSS